MCNVIDTETCLFPNCSSNNVNSHAISEAISLKSISERQHLYGFLPRQFSKDEKKPHFKKISIHAATAHKAFCDDHENYFECLDNNEISTSKELILQVYRSLCVILNQEKSSYISLYHLNNPDGYKKINNDICKLFLMKKNMGNIISKLEDENFLNIIKKRIQFDISERALSDVIEIENLASYLFTLREYNEEIDLNVNKLETITTKNMKYTMFYYITDFQIPVSVNSMIYINSNEKKQKAYLIVIPYNSKNIIITFVPDDIFNYTLEKLNSFFSSNLGIVEYVESIMSICDGWYIKPSIIDKMNNEKKRFFEEDCMFFTERKLFNKYDLSIFDELKNNLIKNKISHIPKRQEYCIRYKNMMNEIDKNCLNLIL